jgi:arylsulfatase A
VRGPSKEVFFCLSLILSFSQREKEPIAPPQNQCRALLSGRKARPQPTSWDVLLVFLAFSLFSLPAFAERVPNIIVIYADDLGWGDVGFNGRKEWKTPHLDRLARQGTVFTRWYAAATTCAPSRAAFITGKYGIHNGVTKNSDDLARNSVTIASILKLHGYKTALFGKWHHGCDAVPNYPYTHPLDLGFDEFFGFTSAIHAWEHFPKELWEGRERKPVSGYANTLFTDRSVQFITKHRQSPFFLYLAYTAPHARIEALPQDIAEHRGKFAEVDPKRPLNATYAAMITRMDKEIGRVLQALDRLQLAEQTLVIFLSDQGATFEPANQGTSAYHDSNYPFRGQKRTLWEGGIRVPAVVRWPGKVSAAKTSKAVISTIDLMPTVITAAQIPIDPAWRLDGLDVLPVWRGQKTLSPRTLFWEWRSEGYSQLAAMRGDLKLIVTGQTPPELFNVESDPGERRSILAEHEALATELQKELTAWLATEVVSPPCR